MNRTYGLRAALLLCLVGQLVLAGCESSQNTGESSAAKSRYPQTTKTTIVDEAHPPKDGAAVHDYDDVAYGKSQLRDDDYHRHWDSIAGNWTPWHHRKHQHNWGDEPMPTPAAPVASNTATGIFTGAARPGDEGKCCGPVVLKKMVPAEVAVGQEYTFTISATNAGTLGVREVRVSDTVTGDFKMTKSDPAAEGTKEGVSTWNLGDLKPGETKTITVTGSASKAGQVTNCATVTFVPIICTTTNVIEPALKLVKTAPEEVLLCDRIPYKLTVTNTGTGTARDVKIVDTLPDGLVAAEGGGKSVTIPVGDLPSGQSRTFTVIAKPEKTGTYENKSTASAAGGLKADASAKTIVRQPVLAIAKTGPKKQFIGRDVTYDIVVKNTGDAGARETVVTDAIGAGVAFVSATDGGTFANGTVTWNLGTLAVKGEKKVSVTVRPSAMGTISNTSMAKAYCAEAVSANASTEIAGIPAVLLEVVDIEDPVQVGGNETYVITVTNQGSAKDTNIKIVVTLEDAQTYVSSSGSTVGTADGKTVTFAPLPSLDAKAKAQWKVTVKASKAGDVRLKVTMNTDQLGRPVEETEATNQYE